MEDYQTGIESVRKLYAPNSKKERDRTCDLNFLLDSGIVIIDDTRNVPIIVQQRRENYRNFVNY